MPAASLRRLVFIDTETRAGDHATLDLKKVGAYRYANSAHVILITYAIGNGPVQLVEKIGLPLDFADLPAELQDCLEDADTIFCAFNSAFDRAILNYALPGSPYLPPERFICAMAQALACNLPGDLESASTVLLGASGGKQKDGKQLIGIFSSPDCALPVSPEAWSRFCSYAVTDTAQLRRVFSSTPQLRKSDWEVFWASERVNERGMAVDLDMCREAARLAREYAVTVNARICALTAGAIDKVTQAKRLAGWVFDRLEGDEIAQDFLVRNWTDVEDEPPEDYEDDLQVQPWKFQEPRLTIARQPVSRLLDYLRHSGSHSGKDSALLELLELREFGASSTPKKFDSILNQAVEGRLRGQFTFNGAGTGRWSGKGVQPQNLSRTPLGGDYGDHEMPIADLITRGGSLAELAAAGDGETPARKLSLIVRNAIVAPIRKTLVKADFSQIEARALPWLADTPGAHELLRQFAARDHDPSLPDLYETTAATMFHKDAAEITKLERQAGKIAVLASGYNGGRHALQNMAANYRVYLSETEAQEMVDRWRAANGWALEFWGQLWHAVMQAYRTPNAVTQAGRIYFTYDTKGLGGAMIMQLPSGRPIIYPFCKLREHKVIDRRSGEVIRTDTTLTYRAGHGFRALSKAVLTNNATQGTCADLLRQAIVRIDRLYPVVLHAHDEIVLEVPEDKAAKAAQMLASCMGQDIPWAPDLPLAVDTTTRWFYSAAKVRAAA